MKDSHLLLPRLENGLKKICAYDTREIDNPDRHHPLRLSYGDRINKVFSLIRGYYPTHTAVRIGDFACAQGNLGLMLAESGYHVVAGDIRLDFLRYSRRKYKYGRIKWVACDLDRPCFKPDSFDIIVLGELIEHCAYPEKIMDNVSRLLKPGGKLIVTTPNGSRLRTRLPAFESLVEEDQRRAFEGRQFGPEGEDHLFLFTQGGIRLIVPKNLQIIESGYLGGTIIINRYTYRLLKILPAFVISKLIRIGSSIPLFNRMTYNNIYAVLSKY